MLFNSLIFIIFFILFFSFWPIVKRKKEVKWVYICVLSAVFYGWWDWRFLFLLIGTGYIDFITGKYIHEKPKHAKLLLFISLASNIASLIIFKYSGFLAQQLDLLFSSYQIETNFYNSIPEFSLVLPVGISFYTFNSMSYTIDIYRKKLDPVSNILHFFAFISFFPHLVAGPIIRAKEILGQLERNHKISTVEIWHAFKLIVIGFFYKMVLADGIAVFVNANYMSTARMQSSILTWFWVIGFAIQIYCDFAGYSSIAKGIAKLCGIQFRMNFNHPYLATSLREFWSRWHISLSQWFRDYLYIPLGGNKRGKIRSNCNMILTMLISGLWHGANFTYLIWGGIHALFLTLERVFNLPKFFKKNPFIKFIGYILVMLQVLVAWVYFRAETVKDGFLITKSLINNSFSLDNLKPYFFDIMVFVLFYIGIEAIQIIKSRHINLRSYFKSPIVDSLSVAFMIFMIVFFHGPQVGFIYFQF